MRNGATALVLSASMIAACSGEIGGGGVGAQGAGAGTNGTGGAGLTGSGGLGGSAGSDNTGGTGATSGGPGGSGGGAQSSSGGTGGSGSTTSSASSSSGGTGGAGGSTCGDPGGGPSQGGGGPSCTFPQGVPDQDFIATACSYGDTDPAVDQAVVAVMQNLTGCSPGSDCPIVGFAGATVDEQCQSFFAAVTEQLRAQGYCAGQHIVGATDEIAVSNTGCTGKWYGYHVCFFGGPKVVWMPGAKRGWWMIAPQYCP